jgi:pilus assembly protein CpaB
MKNKRRIVGILAALILATIGTVALVGYVQSAKDEAVAGERLVEVYVVDELVPKGAGAATITSSVSLEEIPARLEQAGVITDLDDIGDNVAGADLQPGDQLLAARLVPEDVVAIEVDDKVQISATLTPERAVGGTLEAGDLVGVYLSFDPFDIDEAGQADDTADTADSAADPAAVEAARATPATESGDAESGDAEPGDAADDRKTPNVTRLEFQHVLVTNVQTTDEPVVPDEGEADEQDERNAVAQVSGSQYVVTLALSPEQSERFVFATEFGHVWLSKQPATVSDDGTRLVTLGNVYSVVK